MSFTDGPINSTLSLKQSFTMDTFNGLTFLQTSAFPVNPLMEKTNHLKPFSFATTNNKLIPKGDSMKLVIAAAIAFMGLGASAEVLGTFKHKGQQYVVSDDGISALSCDNEANVCENEGGEVPAWLIKLNDWFVKRGYGPAEPGCSNEANPCENEGGKVPQWLIDISDFFKKHGWGPVEDTDPYAPNA